MRTLVAALVTVAAIRGLSPAAQACTPIVKQTTAQRRLDEVALARAAETPALARLVAQSADIFVGHVARQDSAPVSDIPEPFRSQSQPATPELAPVRYVFGVDRVLKGDPGQTTAFKASGQLASDLARDAWMVRASGADLDPAPTRNARDFWHDAYFPVAESEGGPGDCSAQWSFRTDQTYLILRDAQQRFLAAIALERDDILPGLIERLIAHPAEPYPYRPDLPAYLRLRGALLRVVLTRCGGQGRATVLEVFRPSRTPASEVERGDKVELYALTPALSLGPCRVGSQYVLDGWPYAMRLHPIDNGIVRFEDRWMQLRLSGDKTLTLSALRRLTAADQGR